MGPVFGNLRRSRCGDAGRRALYAAQLCAGCHAMREFSGRATSLLANYDQALLSLVASGVAGGAPVARPCTALPWRTIRVQPLSPPLRTLLAAGNLALVDAKLHDDLEDGPRWWTRPVRWLLRGKVRRAYRALDSLDFDTALVAGLPERQRGAERTQQPSMTTLAEPSAALLGAVFAHAGALAGRDELAVPLHRFGRAVGRAVYAFDALDDHDDDRRRGRFNAVAALAARLGHCAAVGTTLQAVELAVVEALQAANALFGGEGADRAARTAIVRQILQHLARRAGAAAERLLGRPVTAAVRPGEAGDCDCACDGCDCHACDGPACECDGGGCGGCDACCDLWCLGGGRRRRRDDDELTGNR